MSRRRSPESLRRKGPSREPYDRVLIVCEGGKTEPNYFNELRTHLRLSAANIEITGECGSSPMSVVDHAIASFGRSPDYNHVYCVIDRDSHPTFDAAVQRVRDKTLVRREGGRKIGEANFRAIPSVPCFEFWILLHYRYTTAELPRFADVLSAMRRVPEIEDYAKGAAGLYARTTDRLPQALQHADRANAAAAQAGTDNPTTLIPELIRQLQDLAERSRR